MSAVSAISILWLVVLVLAGALLVMIALEDEG
jgi:hypothetical protein